MGKGGRMKMMMIGLARKRNDDGDGRRRKDDDDVRREGRRPAEELVKQIGTWRLCK